MNSTVSISTIIWLIITIVLLAALPLFIALLWRRKTAHKINWTPYLLGVAGFIVSARILEMIPHIFCILLDNPVSRFINGHTLAYVIYGIACAGIFEEVGRYIIMNYLMKKRQTKENAITYGLGHGSIEILAVSVMSCISYLSIAILVHSQGITQALKALNITGSTAVSFQKVLQTVSSFGAFMSFLTIYERIICIGVHITLTIIVYYAIKKSRKIYLILAIILHAIFDISPALYQRNVVPMYVCEIWITLWFIISAFIAYRFYQRIEEN